MPGTKIAFRLLFAGLLALLVFGFVHNHLWTQMLWFPSGWKRLGLWSAGFPVLFTALALGVPRRFRAIGLGLILVVTVFWVGLLGPLVCLLFFFSALQLGQLVFGEVRRPDARVVVLLAGVAIYSETVGVLVQFPIFYPVVAWLLLAAPVIARRKAALNDLRQIAGRIERPAPRSKVALAGLGIAALVILAQWLVTLKPEVSADGLAMHLVIPARVLYDHRWDFDVTRSVWAVMPMGGDWFYTLLYIMGGEFAARLGNLGLLLALCGLTFHLTRRFAPKGYAYLAAALFASTPLVQLVTGSLMVENFWASLLFGALAAADLFRRFGRRRWLFCSALLMGVAMASKFGAFAFAVPLFLAICLFARRRGASPSSVAAACGLMLLLACPPFINAYVRTGNPVFPFLNHIFQSPLYPKDAVIDSRFQQPLTWHTLYDLTFHSGRYFEGQEGSSGFHYLVFLPLALLLVRPRRYPAAALCLVVALVYALTTLLSQPNMRYLYAACAPLAVGFAAALAEVARRDRPLAATAVSSVVGLIFLNVCFLASSGWYHKGFYFLHLKERTEYLEQSAAVRGLVDALNRKRPDEPVVFFDTDQTAELQGMAYATSWHNQRFSHLVYESSTPIDLNKRLDEAGVHILVTPTPLPGHPLSLPVVESMVEHLTTPLVRSGRYTAWEIKPEFTGPAGWEKSRRSLQEQLPFPAGEYDDTGKAIQFIGFWTRQSFPEPIGGSITFSDTPGDVATFVFEGTELTWYFAKAYNRGRAEVFIDGNSKGVVDQYSPKVAWRSSVVFGGLPAGKHYFELKLLPDRQRGATGQFIDVDALKVR